MIPPDTGYRTALLQALEARLEALTREGVGWLSIAPHPQAAALLEQARAARAERSVPRDAEAGDGAEGRQAARAAPFPTGRQAPQPAAHTPTPQETHPAVAGNEGVAPPHPSTLATLESLRFQFRDCRNCGLGDTRTRLVFGVGHDRPRLMFVGEGPGAEEDAQGLPFVGRAGRLLTGLIAAMGLTREDVYITNVVKCRPPGNRNPAPVEVSSCRPILRRQIELLNPALVVTLGNVPLKVLNPSAGGITRERGRIFNWEEWQVLPTFHPSYLLHNPAAVGDCWADFRRALELAYPQP